MRIATVCLMRRISVALIALAIVNVGVIVHARTRDLAIARMKRALEAMVVEGVKTTIPLHLKIMDDPKFRAGEISTGFMDYFLAQNGRRNGSLEALAGGAALGRRLDGPPGRGRG